MNDADEVKWDAERVKIFSLDRCIKCLNVLNLGSQTMCSVVVRKREPREAGQLEE